VALHIINSEHGEKHGEKQKKQNREGETGG
jgi:hypothetical protein